MKWLLVSVAAIELTAQLSTSCLAQEYSDKDPSQMSREEWQAHLRISRERAEVARRERRSYVPRLPTFEELAAEASKRVIEDGSLRSGDIISTNRGLFRFHGVPDKSRNLDDFVPIR